MASRTSAVFLAGALASALVTGSTATQRSGQTGPEGNIMLKKLDAAHKLLDAMVLEDFNSIRSNSEQLVRLSTASGWHVIRTLEYTRFSAEFRAAAESLAQAARERNLDAAAMAYAKLTQSCIQCHAHVRRVRKASMNRSGSDDPLLSSTAAAGRSCPARFSASPLLRFRQPATPQLFHRNA